MMKDKTRIVSESPATSIGAAAKFSERNAVNLIAMESLEPASAA